MKANIYIFSKPFYSIFLGGKGGMTCDPFSQVGEPFQDKGNKSNEQIKFAQLTVKDKKFRREEMKLAGKVTYKKE